MSGRWVAPMPKSAVDFVAWAEHEGGKVSVETEQRGRDGVIVTTIRASFKRMTATCSSCDRRLSHDTTRTLTAVWVGPRLSGVRQAAGRPFTSMSAAKHKLDTWRNEYGHG